jgi:hypothetical protein
MAQYNEIPENQPQDKPDIQQTAKKTEINAASAWNEQTANRSDQQSIKDLTRPPDKPKGYNFEKALKDHLKDIPDIMKGDIEKTILSEVGKLAKIYLEGVGELKRGNQRAAELVGIVAALNMIGEECTHGRGPHIKEGKLFTPQELKDRLPPDQMKYIQMNEMVWCKIGNRAGDKDLDRGFKIATDAINKVLSEAKTPEARQKALNGLQAATLPNLNRNKKERLAELKGRK